MDPAASTPVPIGTCRFIRPREGWPPRDLSCPLARCHQAEQGVDYFTVHAGVLLRYVPHLPTAQARHRHRVARRLDHGEVVPASSGELHRTSARSREIMRAYDVSFSLGDGLRPGSIADANDEAQFGTLATLGELTKIAWAGVQVMNEGPGHVPMHLIQGEHGEAARLVRRSAVLRAPGLLTTTSRPATTTSRRRSAPRAPSNTARRDVCYVTPKSTSVFQNRDDVKAGVIAYKIAAHADLAKASARSRRDDAVGTARFGEFRAGRISSTCHSTVTARAYHDGGETLPGRRREGRALLPRCVSGSSAAYGTDAAGSRPCANEGRRRSGGNDGGDGREVRGPEAARSTFSPKGVNRHRCSNAESNL